MSRRINLIGFLTVLVVLILLAKLSEKTTLSIYFQCDRELEKAVVLFLDNAGSKYRVVGIPNKASLLVFNDRIIYKSQTFFLDWEDQIIDETVRQVSTYLNLDVKLARTIQKASFYRKVLLDTDEESYLFELKLRDFALFDKYRIDVIKTILVDELRVFDKGYLVLPIQVEVSGATCAKLSFVFDPVSKDLFFDTTLGGK